MISAVVDGFKPVESIGELQSLVDKLIQVYNPKSDEFIMGKLKKVEESKRTVGGEKITDIVIYLKDSVRRPGIVIDFDRYGNSEKYPTVYIPRVKKREISYMLMSKPSDESSIES